MRKLNYRFALAFFSISSFFLIELHDESLLAANIISAAKHSAIFFVFLKEAFLA
jgi:hypothetical protein